MRQIIWGILAQFLCAHFVHLFADTRVGVRQGRADPPLAESLETLGKKLVLLTTYSLGLGQCKASITHGAGAVLLRRNEFHPKLTLLISQESSPLVPYFLKMDGADVLFDLILGNSKSYLYFQTAMLTFLPFYLTNFLP